jgi:cbb3-type cytochrome oxidase maturation protein
MESMYLLIPLSAVLVLGIVGLFGWALNGGQFEELDGEGERILTAEKPGLDSHQGSLTSAPEQSGP